MPYSLAELNRCESGAFVQALGHLFEHSPWVAAGAAAGRPFSSIDALHAALSDTVRRAPEARQLELLRAHPDLAGRLAEARGLTESSAREQAAAGLDRLTPQEAAEIAALNGAYRNRFGFPFIICARLNDKGAILSAMRSRCGNAPGEERSTALAEVSKIARLRLNDAVSGGA